VSVAGESAQWVDPAEIPAGDDIGKLGRALAAGRHGERDELMAITAAYSGLRWGELTALTIPQMDTGTRVITVDRKVVEVAWHLYVEAPKNRKFRRTIYPRLTPCGYPLVERLAARIEAARAEQDAGVPPDLR
jgi:integrase